MSNLSTLPKGDSAWLLRKAIERIIQQVSVLETNIGASTSGNSANTQIIFNDNGTLRGDAGLVYNKTTDALTVAGLVTAGSATITGALTVDTSTLVVDSTNDRVGVGTVSPSVKLEVATTTSDTRLRINSTSVIATEYFRSGTGVWLTGSDSTNAFKIARGSNFGGAADYLSIDSATANCTWFDGAGGTRMTLNSTGLGVGVAPSVAGENIYVRKDQAAYTSIIVRNDNTLASGTGCGLTLIDGGVNAGWFRRQRDGSGNTDIGYKDSLRFRGAITGTERTDMTLDASGNLLVGTTSATAGVVFKVTGAVANGKSFEVYGTASAVNPAFYCPGSGAVNGVATGAMSLGVVVVNKDSGNLRSISAAGSLNASGADYAEYMTKSGDFVIAKGDVAGIDANGKLTNVFADAVSFVVKSTDPSYVGNDKWGVDLEGAAIEAARQLVDRIAFAGQVPVNVIGATAGDYIVPVVDGTAIKGISVSNPTFEQYQLAVGKVIAIDTDGRARIIVKVA